MITKRTLRSLMAGTMLAAGLLTTSLLTTADATENRRPRIHTNQQFLEDLALNNTLKINDAVSVFQMVLESLPDRVTIYPTENYYYFKFNYAGVQYSGNIRLENEKRDQGMVHFAFSPEYTEWKEQDPTPTVFKNSHRRRRRQHREDQRPILSGVAWRQDRRVRPHRSASRQAAGGCDEP